MPGSEASTVDAASDVIDAVAASDLPDIGDSELRNRWRSLVPKVRSAALETDVDERHARENFERTVELALAHPGEMSISTKPVGRRHDMTSHVRSHFEDLFNDEDWARELKHPRADVDRLLAASELAYLYDSAYRFMRETVVHPEIGGLEDVSFTELPPELHRWMGEVDLLWLTLAGELEPEEPLEGWIDRLYEERTEFVTDAIELEMFLPISGEYLDREPRIESRLSRNANVPSRIVHNYCFSRAVDQF